MVTREIEKTEIMETPQGVDIRNLYDAPEALINVITLKPGESLRQHITPVDVAFFVLGGEGVVEIGDEKKTVGANTLVESPKNIMHCWYNESSKQVRFLVIKVPRPTGKTVYAGTRQ